MRALGGCRVFGQLQGESQTWRWSWCETKDGCPALMADSGCSNGDRRIPAGHFFNTRTGWAVEGFAEEGKQQLGDDPPHQLGIDRRGRKQARDRRVWTQRQEWDIHEADVGSATDLHGVGGSGCPVHGSTKGSISDG